MATETWYEKIVAAHTAVTNDVSHAERMKSTRYFVWQEDGKNDLPGDNRHAESAMTGRTDLYSKTELDPWADEIEESFDDSGISYMLVMAEYEPETGFYHWSWDWEVV